MERLESTGLAVWKRLPRVVRRRLVHWGSPSYTVGVMALIQRDNDDVLLVRQSYRRKWTLPGGLMKRGETPLDAVHREIAEEVGLELVVEDEPRVQVHPRSRIIDIVFRARVSGPPEKAAPGSPEILETGWFAPDALPDLQMEADQALSCWGVRR